MYLYAVHDMKSERSADTRQNSLAQMREKRARTGRGGVCVRGNRQHEMRRSVIPASILALHVSTLFFGCLLKHQSHMYSSTMLASGDRPHVNKQAHRIVRRGRDSLPDPDSKRHRRNDRLIACTSSSSYPAPNISVTYISP